MIYVDPKAIHEKEEYFIFPTQVLHQKCRFVEENIKNKFISKWINNNSNRIELTLFHMRDATGYSNSTETYKHIMKKRLLNIPRVTGNSDPNHNFKCYPLLLAFLYIKIVRQINYRADHQFVVSELKKKN